MIYIKGIRFPNKGAELMLHCILRRIRHKFGNFHEIMATNSIGSPEGYRILGSNGVLQRAELVYKGFDFGRLTNFTPRKGRRILKSFGIAVPGETRVVLDASGLAYTDRFGKGSLSRVGPVYRRVKQSGGKVILLPQAFGPLTVPRFQNSFRRILETADLAYARDPVSLEEALRFYSDGEREKIARAPDITIGERFPEFSGNPEAKGAIGIVLNYRLTEGMPTAVREVFFSEMRGLCLGLKEKDRKLVLILHEGTQDLKLCEALAESLPFNIPILTDDDPRVLKNSIGACRAVFALRYHACVSALSQNVPCFTIGWNHKYKTLFEDFDFGDAVLDGPKVSDEETFRAFFRKVDEFMDCDESLSTARTKLATRSELLGGQVNVMWEKVFACMQR